MEVNWKKRKYRFQVGLGYGLTPGVAVLGGLFLLIFIVTKSNRELFFHFLGFIPAYAVGKLWLWQFVTAIFLHNDLLHLSFNLVALYLFGSAVEQQFKGKIFYIYFLICGMGSFVLTCLLWTFHLFPANTVCIGASGGIFGLLLAFSLLYPKQKLLLFFVIPIQAKWLALICGFLEILLLLNNDGINHVGHLGGLFSGIGYFQYKKTRATIE